MTEADITILAGRAYPRNRVYQLHFIEGFLAEAGDEAAARGLIGSKAERAGRLACQVAKHRARRHPA